MKPNLKAIRERCEAASEPPWTHLNDVDAVCGGPFGEPAVMLVPEGWVDAETAAFIAHARTDIPALLDYCESLEKALAFVMEEVAKEAAMTLGDIVREVQKEKTND